MTDRRFGNVLTRPNPLMLPVPVHGDVSEITFFISHPIHGTIGYVIEPDGRGGFTIVISAMLPANLTMRVGPKDFRRISIEVVDEFRQPH